MLKAITYVAPFAILAAGGLLSWWVVLPAVAGAGVAALIERGLDADDE